MNTIVIAVLAIVLLLILWVAVMYNGLVRGREPCDESWSDIDTELKRRYDLIPNLVETRSRATPRTSARCWSG